jgi:small basic protein
MLPPVWCDAILCAVFKKGDPSVYDNYRGIAVGALMGKIYSMIVEARLDRFCEDHGYIQGHWSGWLSQKTGLL